MNAMLEIRGLGKRFGTLQVLQDFALTVADGEIVAVTGASGVGKTTLLAIVAGVMSPSAGRVIIGGIDALPRSDSVRRLVGYLPERIALYHDLKVEEHLTYRGKLKGLSGKRLRARLRSVIDACELRPLRNRLTRRLSQGEQQMVALADVMLTEPRLMLLDEPFAGLDQERDELVCELLVAAAARHSTLLLATHRADLMPRLAGRPVPLPPPPGAVGL